MEFILDIINNNQPSRILYIAVLLIIALKDIKLSQSLKVGILYLASFLMIFMSWVEIYLGVIFLLLSEFALLEIFTEDSEKRSLFNVWHKIFDCFYKLLVEYYFVLYLLAVAVMTIGEIVMRLCNNEALQTPILNWLRTWQGSFAAWIIVISITLIAAAILCITRMKFESKTVTEIMHSLKEIDIYSTPVESMSTKFNMLIAFEDKTFLDRDECSHTVLSPHIMAGALKYVNLHTLRRPFRTIHKIFSRGYGTIEMQLIRNIGINRGYDTCIIRRKIFEIVYSNLIFNSYRKQFSKNSDSAKNYKQWIIWCYLQKVPVKFNRRFFPSNTSTAKQIFGKDFEYLSLEEFFVWCISLEFFALIGPKTVMKRESIIIGYELDPKKIEAAIQKAYKAK